jgi:hypothetical protein
MLIPNKGRVLVELVKEKEGDIILLNPSSSIGENAQCARIVHPGETSFTKGQLVAVSEYSLMGMYKDLKGFEEGVPRSELSKPENQLHLVAEADIIAYDA